MTLKRVVAAIEQALSKEADWDNLGAILDEDES